MDTVIIKKCLAQSNGDLLAVAIDHGVWLLTGQNYSQTVAKMLARLLAEQGQITPSTGWVKMPERRMKERREL